MTISFASPSVNLRFFTGFGRLRRSEAGPIIGLHFLDRREQAQRNAKTVLRRLKIASANGGG
jgi:hypothetical protein